MTTPQLGHLCPCHHYQKTHYLRTKYWPGLAPTIEPVPAPLLRQVPAVRAVPVLMTLDQEERVQEQMVVKVQRKALPVPMLMLMLTSNAPEYQAAGHDIGRPKVTPNHYQGP
jgi:hypothetical protein